MKAKAYGSASGRMRAAVERALPYAVAAVVVAGLFAANIYMPPMPEKVKCWAVSSIYCKTANGY